MTRQIILLSLAALCLTLNPPVLATNRLVPSQCLTQEAFPISLNYEAEAYAYADRDETETDIGFSTNGKAQAQAHAHFEHREPSAPCAGDFWYMEDSYADNSVEGVSGVEGAWLISTLKGWGEYSGGDECTGYTYGGTGSGVGGGYTLLAGTIGIDADYTMKVEAAVDGSSPGSWESWDWWFKIWDDDANNPIVVLNDSNMSVNLEVLAGQILNVELYHEGGTYSWPENGLESTLKVGLIVGPIMGVSGTEFWFDAQVGGSNPEPQTLSISNIGAGTLNWEITEGCSWLSAEPNSGSSTVEANEVAVIVDISGLAAGLYNCELTVSGEGATGSPQIIEVTLFVRDSYLHVPMEFGTIQEAIDAAVNGETVLVAPGTYTGTYNKNLDFGGKAITVRSINPEDPCVVADTVIDCQNSGRGFNFHSGEEANSVLAGFTVKRGRVLGNPAMGGGIYCSGSSPAIKNCIIRNNRSNGYAGSSGHRHNGRHAYGGGIFCTSGSHPTIVGCMITENAAVGGTGGSAGEPLPLGWPGMGGHAFGGGIYGSGLTIKECVINDNSALGGNGGYDLGDHSYDGAGGDGHGGGIYGSVTISNSIVSGNAARAGVGGSGTTGEDGEAYGGGLKGDSTINNCLIIDNVADDRVDFSSYVRNAGGGVYGGALLANCTISGNVVVDNIGGVAGAATIINCILWGNGDDLGGCSATYSCIEDDDAGEGNIHDNPRFVTGPLGDYYLSQIASGQAVDSPCVDAGSDTAFNLGMDKFTTRTDELKDTSIVDMGYHYPISPGSPDIDGDGDVDFFDYAWFAMSWPYGTSHQIPKGSVLVDGDLSDWPGSVEWRELDKVYWGNPNDLREARFTLQWDDATDKVYVAVVVNDTHHIFLDEYVTWDASDRIEVYSQGDAEDGAGWNEIYDVAQQYYVAPDTIGGSWATWANGGSLGEDVGLEYAVDVNGTEIIYEIGVRMFDNYGAFSGGETVLTDLYAGHVVGFDIVANTRWDTVNFGMLSENLMMYKYKDAGKFARYMLVDEIFSIDLDGNGIIDCGDVRVLADNWLWGK